MDEYDLMEIGEILRRKNEMSKYEIELAAFNNHSYVKIWEIDQNGVRYRNPVMSLGKKKLKIIIQHMDELKQLLGMNEKPKHNPLDEIPF